MRHQNLQEIVLSIVLIIKVTTCFPHLYDYTVSSKLIISIMSIFLFRLGVCLSKTSLSLMSLILNVSRMLMFLGDLLNLLDGIYPAASILPETTHIFRNKYYLHDILTLKVYKAICLSYSTVVKAIANKSWKIPTQGNKTLLKNGIFRSRFKAITYRQSLPSIL